MDVDGFRRHARAWLAEHAATAPPDWGAIVPGDLIDDARAWQRALHDAGLAAIDWPAAYGGRGLSPAHTTAWIEEAAAASVPAVLNMVGLVLAANALLAYGTEAQKRELLPRTATGEIVWCQLFSEPGAGSDLASLSTAAVRDGDEYVVNGQKVWTSNARVADMGILLARTRPLAEAPKHRGISFFVVDMRSAGIDVRPLRQMNGAAEFDEVFFTDVRVPAANLVGPEHEGWKVAMSTLTNERGFIASSARAAQRRVAELAAGAGDRVSRDRAARLAGSAHALAALASRQGPVATSASSLVKLGLAEMALEVASARAADAGAAAMLAGPAADGVLSAPGARIGGGTSEIQRTIVGERLLGLPSEPKP